MANYYESCLLDVTDPSEVGLATGHVVPDDSWREPDSGKPQDQRVCIALGGRGINPGRRKGWERHGWTALTDSCARHLYALLRQHYGDGGPDAKP